MKKVIALAGAVVLLAGCGGSNESPKGAGEPVEAESEAASITVSGALTLREFPGRGAGYADRETKGALCWGSGGYSDISSGALVVIRDATGAQVGLGELGSGRSTTDDLLPYCEFPFEVEGIPSGEGMLTVEVGRRGQVPFSRDEADRVQVGIG